MRKESRTVPSSERSAFFQSLADRFNRRVFQRKRLLALLADKQMLFNDGGLLLGEPAKRVELDGLYADMGNTHRYLSLRENNLAEWEETLAIT